MPIIRKYKTALYKYFHKPRSMELPLIESKLSTKKKKKKLEITKGNDSPKERVSTQNQWEDYILRIYDNRTI